MKCLLSIDELNMIIKMVESNPLILRHKGSEEDAVLYGSFYAPGIGEINIEFEARKSENVHVIFGEFEYAYESIRLALQGLFSKMFFNDNHSVWENV
jgi:hypothetical protein